MGMRVRVRVRMKEGCEVFHRCEQRKLGTGLAPTQTYRAIYLAWHRWPKLLGIFKRTSICLSPHHSVLYLAKALQFEGIT